MPYSPPAHIPSGSQSDAQRRASYEATRPHRHALYGRRWRKLRALYLDAHPLCECGCGYPATVVDHRKPHLDDPTLFFDWNNLEAMTKPCHDAKTASLDGGFGNPVRRSTDRVAGPHTVSKTKSGGER